MAEEIVNKYIMLGFVYEKKTHEKYQNKVRQQDSESYCKGQTRPKDSEKLEKGGGDCQYDVTVSNRCVKHTRDNQINEN